MATQTPAKSAAPKAEPKARKPAPTFIVRATSMVNAAILRGKVSKDELKALAEHITAASVLAK